MEVGWNSAKRNKRFEVSWASYDQGFWYSGGGRWKCMRMRFQTQKAAVMAFLTSALLVSGAVVFERDTLYNHLVVSDENGDRVLYFNRFPQTRMNLRDPNRGHFEYVDYVPIAYVLKEKVKKVLVIGLGGGSIPRYLLQRDPQVVVHSVEIDPWVVRVARDYFGVTESDRHRIIVQDARQYLRMSREKYDVIIADAYHADYYGSYIPYHLVTREFFALIKDHLEPGGVVMYNVIGTLTGWQNQVVRALYKTMSAEFPAVYVVPMPRIYNVEVFGVKDQDPASRDVLLQRAREQIKKGPFKEPTLLSRLSRMVTQPIVTQDVPILTDDYAPVETLGFRGRK